MLFRCFARLLASYLLRTSLELVTQQKHRFDLYALSPVVQLRKRIAVSSVEHYDNRIEGIQVIEKLIS